MKPGVYLTIDVECSMGGAWYDPAIKPVSPERAIWGNTDSQQLGIPLITDILNRNNLAATFFVDSFIDEQGYPGQTEPVCKFLLERGQDVQLHIHPCHMYYPQHIQGKDCPQTDMFFELSPEQQHELLLKGAARLKSATGKFPVAFRAGNMGASEETLKQLLAVGIKIDSSYTFAFTGGQCGFSTGDPYNGSRWYGEVLEMAFSGFYQPPVPGLRPIKVLDPMGISFEECRSGIRQITSAGADAILILHSFSLFKVKDKQYNGIRPNRIVTRRWEKLCRWLGQTNEGFEVYTFSQLAEAVAKGDYKAKGVAPGKLSAPRAVVRKAVQVYNNLYWT
jgi:hypothetical protein